MQNIPPATLELSPLKSGVCLLVGAWAYLPTLCLPGGLGNMYKLAHYQAPALSVKAGSALCQGGLLCNACSGSSRLSPKGEIVQLPSSSQYYLKTERLSIGRCFSSTHKDERVCNAASSKGCLRKLAARTSALLFAQFKKWQDHNCKPNHRHY